MLWLHFCLAAWVGLWTPEPSGSSGDGAIAELRIEVDELAHFLAAERRASQEELASLRAERADLERQVRLEQVRQKTLLQMRRDHTAKVEALEADADRWVEPARRAIQVVRSYVERSLPFARAGRLEAIERIALELTSPRPDVARAMEKLWRLVEEEAALGQEIGRSQQVVEVDGQPTLAHVLHLGMALLYVRTLDGRVGWARRGAGDWRTELVTDPSHRARIEELFTAAERNDSLGPAVIVVPSDRSLIP